MADATPAAAETSEDDPDSLKRYLFGFDWLERNAAVEKMIIDGGLPLWREILRLVPAPSGRGRLLELGSPPFHITLLVQRFRRFHVTPTAGVLDGRRVLRQRLTNAVHGEDHTFECACFDLERERFPFGDESFDAVLFCEVIEHLLENPVFTLSEIHRVLRPGGHLILSTPNAARSGNVMRLWLGANVFDQYHLGTPLRGSRHSHEYTMRELKDLVGGCGFAIEQAIGRNLGQIQYTRRTRPLEPLFRLLTSFAPGVHADYLFVRAAKTGPFRWTFPRELFDQGHLRHYLDIRDADVMIGENDVPHTAGAWGPLETVAGTVARRVDPARGSAFLLAALAADSIEVDFAPAPRAAKVTATATADGIQIGTVIADLDPGSRGPLSIPLQPPVAPGTRVTLEIQAAPEAFVHRMRLRRLRPTS